MDFTFQNRLSDSPLVDSIWYTSSEQDGTFTSSAAVTSGIVVWKYQGKTTLTIRGPETRATPAETAAGAEFFGINFKLGAFMPHLPPKTVMDRQDVHLPEASNSNTFYLHGSTWEIPTYENADTFISRLIRQGLLCYDPMVESVRQGRTPDLSLRMVQYRFSYATGLSHQTVQQIERAKRASSLLEQGTSILDTVDAAGYYDQAHLTRSLKRFLGRTPAQLLRLPE
jgi:hypothetical protein